jgi:hypothetical protein
MDCQQRHQEVSAELESQCALLESVVHSMDTAELPMNTAVQGVNWHMVNVEELDLVHLCQPPLQAANAAPRWRYVHRLSAVLNMVSAA